MRKAVVVLTVATLIAVGSGACRRTEKKTAPVAEIQTQSQAQPVNQPTTVIGCLRAGEASDTFVLTTGADDRNQTATYQLAGAGDIKLADHVGERIEVSGVVTEQQVIGTVASGPARQKTTGTSGGANAPRVETTTELNIRRMDVSAIRPLGGRCAR
ncbi:MAG: hypothetical protein A3H96_09700 [Acidobacteria bacterium RIFCSPLOWO2_02_FULL_67_36]|nr:MAG: hypothetical protein A3H96_09700 [Acidobacteria bacterium RIFCSPLOWO2_02_FULL_67_36]OFW24955.1 MAG: hypothetical protein A3G21_16040 [Acidobacteria bacterium RIFCSPLOWO2_12_FULL_66_21]